MSAVRYSFQWSVYGSILNEIRDICHDSGEFMVKEELVNYVPNSEAWKGMNENIPFFALDFSLNLKPAVLREPYQ